MPSPEQTTSTPDITATPHPDLQRPPVGASGGPVATPATRIPLDFEEYQRLTKLEKEFESYQRAQQKELESKEEQRLRALAEKGNIEEAFGTYKANYEQKVTHFQEMLKSREDAWLRETCNRTVSEALSGYEFVGEDPSATAKFVRRLLEGEVEATMDKKGEPVVRDRELGRPALEYLKDRLESPAYAIFLKAKQRGGAGTDGTRSPATPQPASGPPLDYEQAIPAWQRSQGVPTFGISRKRSG